MKQTNPNDPPEVRFRARFRVNGKLWLSDLLTLPPNACVEWSGTLNDSGYGEIVIDGKKIRAHRYALFLVHGSWPPRDKQVMHSCDNRLCINPHHLSVGTNKDNVDDKVNKLRHNFGETVPQSRLTETQVSAVMHRLARGEPAKPIARELGVHFVTISDIKCGRSWSHIAGVDGNPTVEAMQSAKPLSKSIAKLDARQARAIKIRLKAGHARRDIAEDFSVSVGAIHHIATGRTWSEIEI